MPATLDVSCPNCSKAMKVPTDLEGKRVKCKGCQEIFTVQAPKAAGKKAAAPPPKPAAKPEETKPKKPYEDDDDDDYGPGTTPKAMGVVEEADVARCPLCAVELDPPTRIVCQNCGFNNKTRVKAETKRVHAWTTGDWMSHLAPGIIAALVVIGLIVTDIVCAVNMRGWMEGGALEAEEKGLDGRTKFFVHPGAFIALIIAFSLIVILPAVRFAIRRLAYDYRPEEKLKK
jgi:hypothetical protein